MHLAVLLASFLPLAAFQPANTPASPDLDAVIAAEVEQIRTWAKDATLVQAVREQNALEVPLSRIRSIDISWQTATDDNPRLQALLKKPCSKRLQALATGEGYPEAFVMDDQGALVCTTGKTSDYWQGDEDKWQKSFAEGRGALFVAEPQLDESSGKKLVQVSVPILDAGKAIGVLNAGIAYDALRQRAKKR